MRTLAAGAPIVLDEDLLIAGDNLDAMAALPAGAFDMAYLDPPFNTGVQRRRGELGYADSFADYAGFLAPRLERVRALLAPHGTLYLHLDYREAHRCKLVLDELFGPECFLNELIWIYDYGGRPKRRWPAKHDTILVYVRDRDRYHFDDDEVDREPYMAPGLSVPRRPPAASGRATAGGTRSCRRTRARRPATRRRSRPASCAAWWPPRRAPVAGAWIRSPGRARWAPSATGSGGASC